MTELPLVGRDDLLRSVGEQLRERRPVVLIGHAGVGKSRLARELIGGLRDDGLRTVEAQGDVVSRQVPLGAFAFLIRPDARPDLDVASALWNLQRALLGGNGETVVLYVDDAHLLDPLSTMLVMRIAGTSEARLLLTVRRGEDVPPALAELWSGGSAERIEVEPLGRADLERMIEDLLGAPLARETADEFWTRSEGNPLCARELVTEARQRGSVSVADGIARHDGELSVGGRANELIEARLGQLPDTTADALRLLAVASSLPRAAFEDTIGPDVLKDLERRDLVVVRADGRRSMVTTRHPLYGEIMAGGLVEQERRDASYRLCAASLGHPMRRRGDLVRTAEWALDSDSELPAQALAAAAAEALTAHSPAQAERFALAAARAGEPVDLVLGNALVLQGRLPEASDVFDGLLSASTDEALRAEAAMSQCAMRAFAMKDFAGALAGLAAVERTLTQTAHRDALAAQRSLLLMFTASCDEALAVMRPIIQREPSPGADVLALALGAGISAAVLAGYFSEAATYAAKAEELTATRLDLQLQHVGAALMMQAWMVFHGGDAVEAQSRLTGVGERFPGIGAVADAGVGISLAMNGDHAAAEQILDDAGRALFELRDPMGQLPWVEATRIECAAILGDEETGRDMRDALLARPAGDRVQFAPDITRCLALWELVFGDRERGHALLGESVSHALGLGKATFAIKALDDMARFGWSEEAEPIAREIADRAEPAWLTAHGIARHAEALASDDAQALASSAGEYASWGWLLRGAEIAAVASGLLAEDDPAEAYRLELRSRAWQERIDQAPSPLLAARRSIVGERGDEIAHLVAEGLSNPEMAERLVLSRRTIENHLYRLFRRLGLTARKDLASLVNGARDSARDLSEARSTAE